MKSSLIFLFLSLAAVSCVDNKEKEEEMYLSAEEDEDDTIKEKHLSAEDDEDDTIDLGFVNKDLEIFEIEYARKNPRYIYRPFYKYLSNINKEITDLTKEMEQIMAYYNGISAVFNTNFQILVRPTLILTTDIEEYIEKFSSNAYKIIKKLISVVEWINVRIKSENHELQDIKNKAETLRGNIENVRKEVEQNHDKLYTFIVNEKMDTTSSVLSTIHYEDNINSIVYRRADFKKTINALKKILLKHGFLQQSYKTLKQAYGLLNINGKSGYHVAGDSIPSKRNIIKPMLFMGLLGCALDDSGIDGACVDYD